MTPAALLVPCLLALGPRTADVVGTWEAVPPVEPAMKGFRMVFKKGGAVDLKSSSVTASGTYSVKGDKVTITLANRNGSKPTHPSERQAVLRIVEGGKALSVPTGHKHNGVEVMQRLVRKR